MSEREQLLEEIGALEMRSLALGLPEETSSLLDYDLTLQQLRAFAFVYARGETPISRVGEALGIRPNVTSGIVQRLVERGLIERHEDADDRRVRLLTITAKGFALIEDLAAIVMAKTRESLQRLSDEQLVQLRDILVAMQPPRGE